MAVSERLPASAKRTTTMSVFGDLTCPDEGRGQGTHILREETVRRDGECHNERIGPAAPVRFKKYV